MIAASVIRKRGGGERGQHPFKKCCSKDRLIILKFCMLNKLIFVNFDVQSHIQFYDRYINLQI